MLLPSLTGGRLGEDHHVRIGDELHLQCLCYGHRDWDVNGSLAVAQLSDSCRIARATLGGFLHADRVRFTHGLADLPAEPLHPRAVLGRGEARQSRGCILIVVEPRRALGRRGAVSLLELPGISRIDQPQPLQSEIDHISDGLAWLSRDVVFRDRNALLLWCSETGLVAHRLIPQMRCSGWTDDEVAFPEMILDQAARGADIVRLVEKITDDNDLSPQVAGAVVAGLPLNGAQETPPADAVDEFVHRVTGRRRGSGRDLGRRNDAMGNGRVVDPVEHGIEWASEGLDRVAPGRDGVAALRLFGGL